MSEQKVLIGNSLHVLHTLEPESIDVCVTSPPYWGLRDYWGHYRQDQGLRYSWDRDDIDELEQRIEELEKQIKELERRY